MCDQIDKELDTAEALLKADAEIKRLRMRIIEVNYDNEKLRAELYKLKKMH